MTHDQHELLAHIETALNATEQRAQAARVDLDGVAADPAIPLLVSGKNYGPVAV